MSLMDGSTTQEFVQAADVSVEIQKAGKGPPLLVLHNEFGVPGWLNAYDELAKQFTVYVPSLPGFGQSSRPDWILDVRDLATWVTWFIRDVNLPVPINVMGFSLGGWVAAEIATMNSAIFRKMVLVAPAGIKPAEGEIFDYFMTSAKEAFLRSVRDANEVPEFERYYGKDWSSEEADQIELNREMACRLTWRPYMYRHTLPALLRGVSTPTLLVWGRDDNIVPLNCCEQYQRAIPGAQVRIIDNCGHLPEMERLEEFVALSTDFLRPSNGS